MGLIHVEVPVPSLGNTAVKNEPLLLTDEEPLILTDEILLGEKLSVESANKWPLRRAVLFVVTTSLFLWLGIVFAVQALF